MFNEPGSAVIPQSERAALLAEKLDEFAQEIDPYGYRDNVEDTEQSIEATTRDIQAGGESFERIQEYLQGYIEDDGADSETPSRGQDVEPAIPACYLAPESATCDRFAPPC